jgi:diphosphomevalonate decarboxylase
MNKQDVVNLLLGQRKNSPQIKTARAYAPANIALAKYWGKRNETLNLPFTGSLSISLADHGVTTEIAEGQQKDYYRLNGEEVNPDTEFGQRLTNYLDLFRPHDNFYFDIHTQSNIPIAAGVASSAAGFAALILALNQFFAWNLNNKSLSILARLGSGSASRSLWHGFVQWHAGIAEDGMDCFAEMINSPWPELRVGLLLLNREEKKISSRLAMQQTVLTSPFYQQWPHIVAHAIVDLRNAIDIQDFPILGQTAEANALAMHATMLAAKPSICYWQPETVAIMQKVWQLRAEGLHVYFTEDAGPNIKLLFLQDQSKVLQEIFPNMILIEPFKRNLIIG